MPRFALGIASLLVPLMMVSGTAEAASVLYVKQCTVYGAHFFYIPGTDTCLDPTTGETRKQTEIGTKRGVTELATRVGNNEGAIADLQDEFTDLSTQVDQNSSDIAKLQDQQKKLQERFNAAFKDQADGIAISMALESPALTSLEHFGVKVNWGTYEGSNAFGLTFAGVLAERANSRITLSGGVAFTGNNVGGHTGLQFSW